MGGPGNPAWQRVRIFADDSAAAPPIPVHVLPKTAICSLHRGGLMRPSANQTDHVEIVIVVRLRWIGQRNSGLKEGRGDERLINGGHQGGGKSDCCRTKL